MEKGLIGSSYNIGGDQKLNNLELAIKITMRKDYTKKETKDTLI